MNLTPLTPITELYVCHSIPLDNTYRDTFSKKFFPSASAQASFFINSAKFTFTNLSPVRLQNQIRLPVNADKLYDCNYIVFKNANFSDKYFYAFITKIDFININMSNITIEIDIMQTWLFDYTIQPCFVEREHVIDDTIGANLVEDNLETGTYVFDYAQTISGLTPCYICLGSTVDLSEFNAVSGALYKNVYSGIQLYAFEPNEGNVNTINNAILSLTEAGKSDAIVGIFMCPPTMFETSLLDFNTGKGYASVNGYIPKNNKLFTYPYKYLYVSNLDGTSADYKMEFFSGENCSFKYGGDYSMNPSVALIPTNYKGIQNNYDEKIVLSNYPQCAFNVDTFKAWLAQNGSSLGMSVLSSALNSGVSAGTSLATGNIAGAGASAISGLLNIGQTLAQISDKSKMPPQAHGSQSNSLNVALGVKNFFIAHKTITYEFAKQIDDFWSVFGYPVHETKVPNTTNRPSWNYVKTLESKITGSIPFNDISQIRSIFDKGFTFWHGNFVGDYTRGNK